MIYTVHMTKKILTLFAMLVAMLVMVTSASAVLVPTGDDATLVVTTTTTTTTPAAVVVAGAPTASVSSSSITSDDPQSDPSPCDLYAYSVTSDPTGQQHPEDVVELWPHNQFDVDASTVGYEFPYLDECATDDPAPGDPGVVITFSSVYCVDSGGFVLGYGSFIDQGDVGAWARTWGCDAVWLAPMNPGRYPSYN